MNALRFAPRPELHANRGVAVKDTRIRCPCCGVRTWMNDYRLFMLDHDRPDGRRCLAAQSRAGLPRTTRPQTPLKTRAPRTSLPPQPTARQLLALQPGARLRVALPGRELEVELQGNPWRKPGGRGPASIGMVVRAPGGRSTRTVYGDQVLEVL